MTAHRTQGLSQGTRLDNLAKRFGWVTAAEVPAELRPLHWKRRMWDADERLNSNYRGTEAWEVAYEDLQFARERYVKAVRSNLSVRSVDRAISEQERQVA